MHDFGSLGIGSSLGVLTEVGLRDVASARRNIRKLGERECIHESMKLDARNRRIFCDAERSLWQCGPRRQIAHSLRFRGLLWEKVSRSSSGVGPNCVSETTQIKGSRMRSPRYSSELQIQPDVVQVLGARRVETHRHRLASISSS